MKKISYIAYGLWAAAAMVLKIAGACSWWVATSWVWIPMAFILCFILIIDISVRIGVRLRMAEERKIPDGCEVCLYKKLMDASESGKCMGCDLHPEHEMGKLCDCYKRFAE